MKFSFPIASLSALLVSWSGTPSAHVLAKQDGAMRKKSMSPSSEPSSKPSQKPSGRPSTRPSTEPSLKPSISAQPSTTPSRGPSTQPSRSALPSSAPSLKCDPLENTRGLFVPVVQQCVGLDLVTPKETELLSKVYALADSYVNCVKTVDELRNAINADKKIIVLCAPNFEINSPIDISNKSFEMRCATPPPAPVNNGGVPQCSINGGGSLTQLFQTISPPTTSPVNVKFYGIRFFNGYETDTGGAFSLNDNGYLEFDSCSFVDNNGFLGGGALYIANGAVAVVANSNFSGNVAGQSDSPGDGGAIHVGTGGTLTVANSSFESNTAINRSGQSIYQYAVDNPAGVVNCLQGNTFFPSDNSQKVKQTTATTTEPIVCA